MVALIRTVAEDRLNRRVAKQCIQLAMHMVIADMEEFMLPVLGVAGNICLELLEPNRE